MKSLVVRFLFAGEGEKYGKMTIIIIHFDLITLKHDMYSTFLPRDYSQVWSFPTTLQRLRYGPAEQDEGERDQVAHLNSRSQLISPGLG